MRMEKVNQILPNRGSLMVIYPGTISKKSPKPKHIQVAMAYYNPYMDISENSGFSPQIIH